MGTSQWDIYSHPEEKAKRGCLCVLYSVFSLSLSLSTVTQFSYTSCLGNAAVHSGLDLSTLTKGIKTIPHRHAQAQINLNNPSFRLSFQMIIWGGSSYYLHLHLKYLKYLHVSVKYSSKNQSVRGPLVTARKIEE